MLTFQASIVIGTTYATEKSFSPRFRPRIDRLLETGSGRLVTPNLLTANPCAAYYSVDLHPFPIGLAVGSVSAMRVVEAVVLPAQFTFGICLMISC